MAEKKKAAPRKPRDPNAPPRVVISNEEFVVKWQAAATLADARAALGNSASGRAGRLRKKGVKLKEFSGGRSAVDVGALNALIAGK